VQPLGQVALGQRDVGVQFVQRERLGQRHRMALVGLQQAGRADEVHQQGVQPRRLRVVHPVHQGSS
jgi:hypothetical protein